MANKTILFKMRARAWGERERDISESTFVGTGEVRIGSAGCGEGTERSSPLEEGIPEHALGCKEENIQPMVA